MQEILSKSNYNLHCNAYYNPEGILAFLEIYIRDLNPNVRSSPITIFRMVNFYDGPKPYYVGANINEINEYGVYYFEENAPSYADPSYYPERIKTEIKYIGGEDLEHNRTIVIIDYFQRYYSQEYWNI